MAATCALEESPGIHSRQAISLKKVRPEGRSYATASQSESTTDGVPYVPGKVRSGKRNVPVTFMEVIDKLLDVVLKFDPLVALGKDGKEDGKEKEKAEHSREGLGGMREAVATTSADAFARLRSASAELARQFNSGEAFQQLDQLLLAAMPSGASGSAGSGSAGQGLEVRSGSACCCQTFCCWLDLASAVAVLVSGCLQQSCGG